MTAYLVDPDESIGEGLKTLLATYGIRVESFPDAEALLETHPDICPTCSCVLAEVNLPGLSGPALANKLHQAAPDLPIFLLVSTSVGDLSGLAQREALSGVIRKPLVNGALIGRLLEMQKRLRTESPSPLA